MFFFPELFLWYTSLPLLFLVAIPLFIIAEIAFLSVESGKGASGALMIVVLALGWWFHKELWTYFSTNWVQALLIGFCYLVIGSIWSFVKFTYECYIASVKYTDVKADTLREYSVASIEDLTTTTTRGIPSRLESYDKRIQELMGRYTRERFHEYGITYPYTRRSLLSSIMLWIFYWPFSILASIFGDMLVRMMEAVVRVFGRLYDTVSNYFSKQSIADSALVAAKLKAAQDAGTSSPPDGRASLAVTRSGASAGGLD